MIGRISERYGRDVADVTDRQNIQLHWIRIEDMPADLGRARGRRAIDDRSVRRHPAQHPRMPAGGIDATEIIDASDCSRRGERRARRQPRVLEPPAQVQDLDLGLRAPMRPARDQRRRPRGRACNRNGGASDSTSGSAGASARIRCSRKRLGRVRRARAGRRRRPRHHHGVPRLGLPAGTQPRSAEVPGEGLGAESVPRGAREDRSGSRSTDLDDPLRRSGWSTASTSASGRRRTATSYVGFAPKGRAHRRASAERGRASRGALRRRSRPHHDASRRW